MTDTTDMDKRTLAKNARDARVYRTLAPDDPRHGRYSSYINQRCRCDACRKAHTEYIRVQSHIVGRHKPREDMLATVAPIGEDTLRCSKCHQWFPDEEFPRAARKGRRRGRHSWCTACSSEQRRLRRAVLRRGQRGLVRFGYGPASARTQSASIASRGMSTPDSSRVSAENHRAPDGEENPR